MMGEKHGFGIQHFGLEEYEGYFENNTRTGIVFRLG